MSREAPRDAKWAEWYSLHQDVASIWMEDNGYEPWHELFCENDPKRRGQAHRDAACWCSAFCGFCDHHENKHTYGSDEHVSCVRCPGGLCPREPAMSHRGR